MLSESSKVLMEHLITLYKQYGINEFNIDSYVEIPNHEFAIQELIEKGYLHQQNNILATLSINLDAIKE